MTEFEQVLGGKDSGPPGPDRPTAWACLATNLLVLPGLGSVIAGRRLGYLQMGLAVVGIGLTLVFVAAFLKVWFKEADVWTGWGPVVTALVGIALFGISWLWSLWTGITMLRKEKRPPVIGAR